MRQNTNDAKINIMQEIIAKHTNQDCEIERERDLDRHRSLTQPSVTKPSRVLFCRFCFVPCSSCVCPVVPCLLCVCPVSVCSFVVFAAFIVPCVSHGYAVVVPCFFLPYFVPYSVPCLSHFHLVFCFVFFPCFVPYFVLYFSPVFLSGFSRISPVFFPYFSVCVRRRRRRVGPLF